MDGWSVRCLCARVCTCVYVIHNADDAETNVFTLWI